MQQPTFLYFAYGSNMLTRRLARRCPSARPLGVAFVEGKQLTFSKVSKDGSGKCHLEPVGNGRVYGVLFSIATSEKAKLDAAEGLGHGYREDLIDVSANGAPVAATAYIATNTDAALLPYHWYKEFVLQGAIEHQLPAASIALIQAQRSKSDPDDSRRVAAEALL
ncbi:MAG: gamma-glutamylcyclotransferase [Candidatus Obscuribacterales bacterium]|nr:gamma-glutamylcyclotransferase [Candidatus Obscuribacterales bacterium]